MITNIYGEVTEGMFRKQREFCGGRYLWANSFGEGCIKCYC